MRSLLLIALVACETATGTTTTARPVESPGAAKPANPDLDARFVATIREAASPYRSWGRVDQQARAAPTLCDMPRPDRSSQGRVHMSEAADAPHGKKLYYLWASDRAAYKKLEVAAGFTIVKESFAAVAAASAEERVPYDREPPLHAKVKVGDAWMTTGEAHGLYVMKKVGDADGTDAGWIYGTLAASGEVTSAGRVASCIGCHEDAPHDRLFGLKAPNAETHGF